MERLSCDRSQSVRTSAEPKVDLCFWVSGSRIPVDHGFSLYGALSRILPHLHEAEDVAVKTLRGRYVGEGLLDISPSSQMILRIPASEIAKYLPLAGKHVDVQGFSLTVGIPRTCSLIPAHTLYSPLVTTKNGHDQARFETEMNHQMERLGLGGRLSVGRRRTFGVHGKQVVGYAVLVSELSAEESILLQEEGLGGRRKMGCGFFEVWRATP